MTFKRHPRPLVSSEAISHGARSVLKDAEAIHGRNRLVGQHVASHVIAVVLGLGRWRVERGNVLVQQPLEVARLQGNMLFPVQSRWPVLDGQRYKSKEISVVLATS